MRPLLPVLAAFVALIAPTGASAATIQPVEGTWNLQDGQVTVAADGSGGFVGSVTRPLSFSQCTHPIGERIWTLTGSGASYGGTHQWIDSSGSNCAAVGRPGAATFSLSETTKSLVLRFCTNPPGEPAPEHGSGAFCADLTRAKPPAQTETAAAAPTAPGNGQLLIAAVASTAKSIAAAKGCTTGPGGKAVLRVTVAKLIRKRKSLRPRLLSLTKRLDGKAFGRRQTRAPFTIRLSTGGLKAGPHKLEVTAKVRLRPKGKPVTRRLAFRFKVCR